ncbi:MAG TPA: diguanylate cyclase [Steroidobacteraceae bacterium]|nr:diguanylate cyclase [Steroidobacteraceae bacterium]
MSTNNAGMGSTVQNLSRTIPDGPAETLYQTTRTRVTRRSAPEGVQILKQPLGPGAGDRLRHERAMLARLTGVHGVLAPVEDPLAQNSLVFADAGGVSLSTLLATRRLETGEVLRLALALARITAEVHRRGVVHKDINPANVVVGVAPLEAWLIDFDLASVFAEERLAFKHLTELSGTLPYMAPEQTGRTGRALDARADLYSLGATLYAAATGRPPFEGDDPLKLVHDHLARAPLAPDVVDANVPRNLSRIVMRLLEKEPDARYQSADGLVFDLTKAYELWSADSSAEFKLGERDFPARLRPPSRLLGRESELHTLRRQFDEVAHGACAMVLVSGAPGVGKSALMDDVRGWVTPAGGLYAAGKFDVLQQDGEADGVRQALRAVLRLLLAEPESELAGLRERLRTALGMNAPLAGALLPEVAHLLQLDPQTVAPAAARQTRASLQQITQLLLRTLAQPGRPIVLVIDDLQWAPRTALDMLDAVHLDEDMRGVLILASYRHSEVDATHPLRTLIARWKRLGLAPRELHLENLRPTALVEMLAECLRLSPDDARSLSEAVRPLTGGNPFDTLELIDSLRRDGILLLETQGWRWDGDRIHQHLEGRNVDALVAQRLEGIPAETTWLLDAMACVGGVVPLARLAVASDVPELLIDEQLAPALHEGLLVRDSAQDAVQFRHDRVLQSLVSRLNAEERAGLQLQVARRLAKVPEHAGVAAEIYLQVVDRLNDASECAHVVTLFRGAAAQARLAVNWAQIERYAREGLTLLVRGASRLEPEAVRELRLRLATDHHAALYGMGRLADADAVYRDIILPVASDALQRADASLIQITSLTQRDRPGDAVRLGLDLLRDLGLPVPADHEAFEAAVETDIDELYAWGREPAETHVAQAECRDPHAQAIARTINRCMPPAFYSDHLMLAWLIAAAARLWRTQGAAAALIGPLSHSAFVTVEFRDDYRGGHDIVARVLEVATARNYELDGAQARFTYALSGSHWMHPLEQGVAEARSAQELLLRAGELHFGYGVYNSLLKNLVDCASSLDELEMAASTAVDSTRRIGNEQAGATFHSYRQFARCLRGGTDALNTFSDDGFDETEHVQRLAANPVGLSNYRILRALAALIAGDFDTFVAQMDALAPVARYTSATWFMSTGHILQALAIAHRARAATGAERDALIRQLNYQHDWIAGRAADCPANFQHLLKLVEAERAWVNGDFQAAAQAYDAAWQLASERPRFWQRGVILEQSARCRQAYNVPRTANLLQQRARAEYAAWGAQAKCAAMGPGLDDDSNDGSKGTRRPGSHRSGSTHGGEIDLLAILKAAQALQSETDPDKLLDNVSTVVSALSGATSVRLALWSEDTRTWFADEKHEGERRQVPFEQAVQERLLPSTAFRYAQRTREPLVVDDALTDERFRRDPYFTGLQRCSLMIVPVLSRGMLKAMLVLENRKAQGMFVESRLDGVMLIAGQLAASLENALLAESIERRVAQRVAHLDEDNERLTRLSETDALTGLANRRRLDAELPRLVAEAARRGTQVAVAMIDVDHFKLFNDRYGHQAGDECLAKIGALLRESARDSDLVARYGGEEFALVLPRSDLEAALHVAERARALVQAQAIAHAGSSHDVVTLSIGVAAMMPRSGDEAAKLVHLADEALYHAKGTGRNRVEGVRAEHDISD